MSDKRNISDLNGLYRTGTSNLRTFQSKPLNNAMTENNNSSAYDRVKNSMIRQDGGYSETSTGTTRNESVEGVGHRIGARFFGEHNGNKLPFATGFNHVDAKMKPENRQHEIENVISKFAQNKMPHAKTQIGQNKGYITTHFNDSLAALLKTGILVEDNDISQSNEHSNPDLTNSHQNNSDFKFKAFNDNDEIPYDGSGAESPSVEEDLSQVSNQLKLIQQTQDTILASLRNDIEVVQTENLVLQQNNTRLQNQVNHLTQLVADLKFDLYQMHEIVKSNAFNEENFTSTSKRVHMHMNEPVSPPSIASPCSIAHEEEAPQRERRSSFRKSPDSKTFGQSNTSNQKQYNYVNKGNSSRSSSRVKMNDDKYGKRAVKSIKSEYRQKSTRGYENNDIDENYSQKRRSSRKKSNDESGTGCFGFFKSNKKTSKNQTNRDRESSRRQARSSGRSRIPKDEEYY